MRKLLSYSILILLLSFIKAYAQPSNDNCSNATVLCHNQTLTSESNLNATGETGIAGLCFTSSNSVWYQFTASVAGDATVTLSNINALTANIEYQVAIISFGTNCNLTTTTIISCNNSSTANAFAITGVGLIAGKSYYVLVDGGENFAPPAGEFTYDISVSGSALTPTSNIIKTNETCNKKNGSIKIRKVKFTSYPYQYQLNSDPITSDSTFLNLVAGVYQITIIDGNGCSFQTNTTILNNGINSIQSTTTNADCSINSLGSITMNVLPANSAYQYSLDGTLPQSSKIFPNVIAGTHFITISGINCDTTVLVVVSSNNVITSAIGQGSKINCGASNGTISYPNPVAPPAPAGTQYLFKNVTTGITNTTGTFQNLPVSSYTIEIYNSADTNCRYTDLVTVQALSGPIIDTTVISADECEGSNGKITIRAKSGVKPYTYSMDGTTFQTEQTFENLTAGTYNVTVKDAFGCTSSALAIVSKKVPGTFSNCDAGAPQVIIKGDKALVTIVAPANANISFSPSSFSATVDEDKFILFPSASVTYLMTVTLSNGCICNDDVEIEVKKPMDIPNTFTPNGDSLNDKFTIDYIENYRDVEITVLDRWGVKVYYTTNYTDATAWDGKANETLVPVGPYYYVIRFKFPASKNDENFYYYQGCINIIR